MRGGILTDGEDPRENNPARNPPPTPFANALLAANIHRNTIFYKVMFMHTHRPLIPSLSPAQWHPSTAAR